MFMFALWPFIVNWELLELLVWKGRASTQITFSADPISVWKSFISFHEFGLIDDRYDDDDGLPIDGYCKPKRM